MLLDTDSYRMVFDDPEKQWATVKLILDASNNRVKDAESLWKESLCLLYTGWTREASMRDFDRLGHPTYAAREFHGCMFCSSGAVAAIVCELLANKADLPNSVYSQYTGWRDTVLNALRTELKERGIHGNQYTSIPDFNDKHKFGEVVQLWRDAGERQGWKFTVNDLPPDLRPLYPNAR